MHKLYEWLITVGPGCYRIISTESQDHDGALTHIADVHGLVDAEEIKELIGMIFGKLGLLLLMCFVLMGLLKYLDSQWRE